MFLLITDENKAEHADVLDRMHRLRHEVFVEQLRWKDLTSRDGREYDGYDVPGARYIVMVEDDEVVASVRLHTMDGPTLLSEVFPHLVEFEPVPEGARTVDLSRFMVSPYVNDTTRMGGHGAEIIAAILEYGVAERLDAFTAVISPHFLATVLQWGVEAYAMGFPVGEGRDAHLAVRVPVSERQVSQVYHFTRNYHPRLMEPAFVRWHRETFGSIAACAAEMQRVPAAAD